VLVNGEHNSNRKHKIVNFHVVSLFTNMPLDKTKDEIISHLYNENNDNAVFLTPKNILRTNASFHPKNCHIIDQLWLYLL